MGRDKKMVNPDFGEEFALFYIRATTRERTRRLRREHIDVIEELLGTLERSEHKTQLWKDRAIQSDNIVADLRTRVANFEKLISARDRFGCWVCSRHEHESMIPAHADQDV